MGWNAASFIALAVVLALLAAASTMLRFRARYITKARIGTDDILTLPAMVCVLGMAATMIVEANHLAKGARLGEMAQHQTNDIGADGPIFTERLRIYEICNYVLQILPLLSLGFSKLSVLFLYRRIFYMHQGFLTVNLVLMVVVAAWAISFIFVTVLQCKDPVTLWTSFEYARTNCVETVSFYYAVSITGFITDLMILVSPLPIIWTMQLPWEKRIGVAGVFLLGALVCGAGIARFVTFVNIGRGIVANINDLTYFTTPVFAWTMVESSLAVVSANLPLLRSLVVKRFPSKPQPNSHSTAEQMLK
ncbi:hypothetical protein AAL_07848 [Moelleriella libera RCEF 2490]|uniref:Rhodopsin domain-containing protein n=1 Tax=Moelleriella libera RCEF 2490 TaxID=1081109 RepID=A0A166ND01_9HYPO|nr:hypothetical protein AAL_07848 [Moelleriella libera RCEF 2490]